MSTPSYTEEGTRRRVQSFARKFGKQALQFACHAAVPVVLTVDFVHLLRINFFFDQSETLPYATETDLLFSSLCTELGGGLYEMEPAVRNALLAELLSDEQFGQKRIREIATLLWEYSRRYSPWGNRLALERAQQLTALNFLDREKATRWLEEAEEQHRGGAMEDREWFVAMQQELQKLEPVLSQDTAPDVPPDDEVEAEKSEGNVPAGLRFVRQLRGRKSKITRIGWSPDGRTLAVPYKDKAIILWDAHTGEPRHIILLKDFKAPGKLIHDMSDRPRWAVQVTWSPDGKRLACGLSDSSILILDAEDGVPRHILNGHSRSVNSVAWSPDGRMLASASDDKTVRLWDVNNGTGLHVFSAHTHLVNMVVWAPDGLRFASCADDSTIQIYDPLNRIKPHELRGHRGQIFSLAWSPDGLRIASGDDEGVIKIWNTRSWAETDTLEGHGEMVGSLSFSHNSRLLASKSWDGTVLIWRFDRGWETAARLDEPSAKDFALSLAFSPTAPTLATLGSRDTAVRLWKTDYGRLLAPARPEAEPVVRSFKAHPPFALFYSYSHKDKQLRDKLDNHLSVLQRQGFINERHDRMIEAGDDWESEVNEHLDGADIILLLVSEDFIASGYCYSVEMQRALERHEQGEARVIPVILRPVDWESSPFGKLQALPKGGKAVTLWRNRDDALRSVAKGIREIVRSFQPKQESPLASLIPRRPVFGFVARRDYNGGDILTRLKEELSPGRGQLVTLSGPGGVGKTTLAAEAARELQAVYKGRVVWSSADGRADFTFLSLLDDIATQLGSAGLRTLAPAEKEEQVRAVASGALVVLDNYETVAEAERARIEAWFKRTQCSAIFTSRPRVPDTVFVPVSAMSREEAAEFLERLTGQTLAPQLFTSEVRERIYQTAEANPFVMQWLVGQMDLAKEPGAVLEELRHGEGDAAENIFYRSFALPLLGEDGRDALLALSLFAPSASREALAQVAGFGDDWTKRLDEAVKNLHALWLVKGVDGNRRLAVEGLTRTLAAARRSKDPRAEEFRRRFVAYFLRFALERENPSPENYDALEVEKDNLLGAADVAFASGDRESVTRMAYTLARGDTGMLGVRGYWGEAVKLGEQGLQAARSLQDEAQIAGLSHNLAMMYQNRGEVAEARRLFNESLKIKKRLGDQSGVAITLHQLGNLAQGRGELEEARRLFDESLEIAKRLGHQSNVALILHSLALLAQDRGDLDEARRLFDESLEIAKRLGHQSNVALTLHSLALLAQDRGELEEARRLYNEGLNINSRLGNQSGIAATLSNLGRLAEQEGNNWDAARLYRESLNIFERLGSPNAEVVRRNLERVGAASS